MTDDRGTSARDYQPGDVANGHILTAAGWIPLRRLPHGSPGPFYPGDMLGGNAYTGSGWVPVPLDESARVPRSSGTAVAGNGSPTPSPSGRRWVKGIAIGVAVLVGLGIISGVVDTLSDENTSPATKAKAKKHKPKSARTGAAPDRRSKYAAKMKAAGWSQAADALWIKQDGGPTADQFSITWKVRVVSPAGCPNGVYLEANVLDTSNTVVGYTNDVVPSLPANQEAVLQLSSTAEGTIHLQPTKATCY